LAVVLFTDLVGSTELRSRLGEDAAEALRHEHDALVTGAIKANRGRVVKHLGDGVMATFTAASDAVAAGIRVQQVLERHNRSSAAALEVRIGMSAGDVAFEKEDCFGTPVIEAARLCAAARGGQVLLSDIVRLLAGSAGGHQFAPVGELELKGLPAPLPSFEVAWQPLPAAPLPLPSLLTAMGRIFVGREEQTGGLLRLWKEAAAGERRVALLAGEPGIGKTRLAAELAALVHDEGAVVLAGRCDEDMGVPYQPFVEALRHFVDHSPLSSQRLGRYGGELVRLLPELTERVVDLAPPLHSDAETERYRLFDAVAAWLAAVSAETPLLLVLDDLQWAAKPTLLLLRHVARSSELSRILVACTYRDSEIGHDLGELLADLRREVGIERISLVGLDVTGVVAFVQQASGHALEDDEGFLLARAIHDETEGNPLFVREVLRHLAETGGLEGGTSLAGVAIPESIRDVVGRRLARLSKATNELLRVAAVAGAEFELPLVQTAGSFDEAVLVSSVEEAAKAHLVTEAALRYRFAHALVRDTLYDGLSAARLGMLHRRLAEAIETLHEHRLEDYLPALAHHWGRAPDAERVIDYARRAGDRALAQLAHDEAASYYGQALDLLDVAVPAGDDRLRIRLLIALGEAQRRAGDPAHRQTLLEAASRALARGDADALAHAALANNRGIYSVSGFVDDERVMMLEAALQAIGPGDTPLRARLLAVLAAELGFARDHAHRQRLSTEALAMARRLGDLPTLGDVLARRWAVMAPTAPHERRAELDELAEVAQRLDDPTLALWAAMWGSANAGVLGDGEAYRMLLHEGAELARHLSQPFYSWLIAFFQTTAACIAGRLAEAEEKAVEALEIARVGGIPDGFQVYGAGLLWIRYEQGRLEEVVQLLQRAVARGRHNPLTPAALAVTLCALGRHDEARPVFEGVAADDFASLPGNFVWLYGLCLASEACARLGDSARAEVLHGRMSAYGHLIASAWGGAAGFVDFYLGLLATTLRRFDLAERHFDSAERLAAGFPAPAWLGRTRLEWAAMLHTRRQPGDAERARELLGQALATARELGLANVERRAVELLESA
jgi:class 3 adenylate cyclase/tetratricopeptide (TPR) repeat protein